MTKQRGHIKGIDLGRAGKLPGPVIDLSRGNFWTLQGNPGVGASFASAVVKVYTGLGLDPAFLGTLPEAGTLDLTSGKPLTLDVRGKDTGFLSVETTESGKRLDVSHVLDSREA